jgi:hypothetical protein
VIVWAWAALTGFVITCGLWSGVALMVICALRRGTGPKGVVYRNDPVPPARQPPDQYHT